MKASDLLVKCLETEGVKYIFGVPGEENLDLLESIRKSSIRFILTRHEQGAGFMAATVGRLTGLPGVALSTLGPGALNLATSAAFATLGGMPAVFITGQKRLRNNEQGLFQIIDAVSVFRPITKLSKQITDPNPIASIVVDGLRLAQSERPGCVHLELPEDVATSEVEDNQLPASRFPPAAKPHDPAKISQRIIESKRPLILIGAKAVRLGVSDSLTALIEKTGIPFFSMQLGKGVVDERHALYLGTPAVSEGDIIHKVIDQSDLIINVGFEPFQKPPFVGKKYLTDDVTDILPELAQKLAKQAHWNFEPFLKIKTEIEQSVKNDLVSDIRSVIPQDGIVCLDNGLYKLWFARNYKAYKPNALLLDNSLATMAAGLPSAIAAKLLYPDKKVLAVCGDGGFMMSSQELETAQRLNLDLVVLILNDNGFGMIKWKQQKEGFEEFGLDFGNPDYVKYAESFGAQGYKIDKTRELLPILKQALDSKGIHVIDCPIDYSKMPKFYANSI